MLDFGRKILLLTMLSSFCQSWVSRCGSRRICYKDMTRHLHRAQHQHRLLSSKDSRVELLIPTALDMEEVGAAMYTAFSSNKIDFTPATICLDGDLGAGKTAFCRGFIRAATGEWGMRITSPTYLLSNTYIAESEVNTIPVDIRHMDLYRLTGKSTDLTALDLDHVFSKCISLIEWPERMGALLPMDRLDIRITIFNQPTESSVNESTEDESDRPRQMVLQPHGTIWQERVDYLLEEGYVDDLIIDRLTSAS